MTEQHFWAAIVPMTLETLFLTVLAPAAFTRSASAVPAANAVSLSVPLGGQQAMNASSMLAFSTIATPSMLHQQHVDEHRHMIHRGRSRLRRSSYIATDNRHNSHVMFRMRHYTDILGP